MNNLTVSNQPNLKEYFKKKEPKLITRYLNQQMAEYLRKKSIEGSFYNTHKMAIFAHDWICININQFGVYELEGLEILFDFLSPLSLEFKSGVAVDAGAHVGNHSLYFTNFFKHVVSYEPNPKVFELLEINARGKEITVKNKGLGDEKGSLEFYVDSAEACGSSFIKDYHGIHNIGKNYKNDKIDAFIERLDDSILELDDLIFLKIDTEGFELNVLKGARETLKKHMPIVVIEQHEHEFLEGTTPSIQFLTEMGYTFCWGRKGSQAKSWVLRRLYNVWELFFGKTHTIIGNDIPPVATYSMLICIPPRISNLLIKNH